MMKVIVGHGEHGMGFPGRASASSAGGGGRDGDQS